MRRVKREGKCYQLAYHYLLEHGGSILIHAEVYSFALGKRISHALVENEIGLIYEPVVGKYFTKDFLYPLYDIKEHARYTLMEALDKAFEFGTYGPWED